MNKRFSVLAVVMTAIVTACATCLIGCSLFGGGDDSSEADNTPQEYVVRYTDDSGEHKIDVKVGSAYSIEELPERDGYDFTGLFDKESGGTQYIGADGGSLKPFDGNADLVLYPQYTVKNYTVVLEYGGADITGERQVTVTYGEQLPELPKNLTVAHKNFKGWYTEQDCKGVLIADRFGLIPTVSVFNTDNFDISLKTITLYAGFETEKILVTFNYGDRADEEEMFIDYNTPVKNIVTETRVGGKGVLTWSKTDGGEVWSGRVTEPIDLYALEYAPVIELDLNGGKGVSGVIAKAGADIVLPTPQKDLSEFMYWADKNNNEYTADTMPTNGEKLKAVWQAKIVFNENGGTDVEDISEKAGTVVKLPIPDKKGYVFAGWYSQDKQIVSMTTMPEEGMLLKAGWYKAKTKRVDFGMYSVDKDYLIYKSTPTFKSNYKLNLGALIPEIQWNKIVYVKLNYHASIRHACTSSAAIPTYYTKEHFWFYSQENASDAYLYGKVTVDHGNGYVNESYTPVEFDITLPVGGGIVYTALSADENKEISFTGFFHNGSGWMMDALYVNIDYPNTAKLYL